MSYEPVRYIIYKNGKIVLLPFCDIDQVSVNLAYDALVANAKFTGEACTLELVKVQTEIVRTTIKTTCTGENREGRETIFPPAPNIATES